MEADQNPFPKIDLFPRVTKLCHFLFDHFQNEGISEHIGGAENLLAGPIELVDGWPTTPATHDHLCIIGLPEQQEFDYGEK